MPSRKAYNAAYYARTRNRLTFLESELQPSTVAELIENLSDLELSRQDRRLDRLHDLYQSLTGHQYGANEEQSNG